MAVDSGSASKQKKTIKTPQKKGESKLKANVTPSPVSQSVRGRIGDSGKGKTCHQCRHQHGDIAAAWCTNQINNKKCTSMYCYRCLMNRYAQKAEEVSALGNWNCPKCQGTCNCSICMRRRGQEPIGMRTNTAKASSEMPVKRKKVVRDPKASGVSSVPKMPVKRKKVVRDLKASGVSSVPKMPVKRRKVVQDVVKTPKKELTSVAGIDVPSKHVGNALQFLEFCAVFGKILDVKKGEPEYVLQELLDGQARGKFSATVQFQIHLLSLIQNERGEKSAVRKSSWFNVLKECSAESQNVLKAQGMDLLDLGDDYETLEASDKLKLLILLCDEVLGTEKVRNWLRSHKAKDAKQKPLAAKDKDRSSKLKMKDDIAEGITNRCDTSNAVRVVPIFVGCGGETYWKLNAFGKSEVLCQSVGKGDTLSLDEKWSSIDDEGKEALEKHISSLRDKVRVKDKISGTRLLQ